MQTSNERQTRQNECDGWMAEETDGCFEGVPLRRQRVVWGNEGGTSEEVEEEKG